MMQLYMNGYGSKTAAKFSSGPEAPSMSVAGGGMSLGLVLYLWPRGKLEGGRISVGANSSNLSGSPCEQE